VNETAEASLKEGFRSWRSNKKIGIPYLLSTVITAIALLVSIIASALAGSMASAMSEGVNSSMSTPAAMAVLCISILLQLP